MKRIIYLSLFMLCLSLCAYPQTRRALLVGISNYDTNKTQWEKIHGTNDVALINKALTGFKITKLVDNQATYDNIIKALKTLINQTASCDIVYLHFSGHGQPVEDYDGDEDDGWDEAFIPYDAPQSYKKGVYEGEHHFTDDILHTYIEQLRKKAGSKGIIYVSIDACHSGDSFRGNTPWDYEDEKEINIEDNFISTLNLVCDETDTENDERGSSSGFSMNDKPYAVSRSKAKIHGRIVSSSTLANVVVMESCLSTEKSKEIKLTMKDKNGKKNNFYCGPLSYSIYKVLTKTQLPVFTDTSWVKSIRPIFESIRQSNNQQQLVIEMSE